MGKGFLIGAAAGAGYLAAATFVPSTNSGMLDKAINVVIAGVVGMAVGHFLK